MDHPVFGGQQTPPDIYDYRMYDRIWQRVSPELVPYPQVRSGSLMAPADPEEGTSAGQMDINTVQDSFSNAASESGQLLPGAQPDPCCMGSAARDSVAVLEGFVEELLAQRRCYLALSQRLRHQEVSRLFSRIARDKLSAAQELRAALFLITGSVYEPTVSVGHRCWKNLAEILRSSYHQEACNGFNYQRAGDETTDPCLQKLLNRLGQQSYRHAEQIMALLGEIMGKH